MRRTKKEPDKVQQVLDSLNDYIERREKLLEEENQALLEKGKQEFEAAITEKVAAFEQSEIEPVKAPSKGAAARLGRLSTLYRKTRGRLSRLLRRKFPM